VFENLISSGLLVPVLIAVISATAGFFIRGSNRRETRFLQKENYRLKHVLDMMLDKTTAKNGR
jgi:hypothetical protein